MNACRWIAVVILIGLTLFVIGYSTGHIIDFKPEKVVLTPEMMDEGLRLQKNLEKPLMSLILHLPESIY